MLAISFWAASGIARPNTLGARRRAATKSLDAMVIKEGGSFLKRVKNIRPIYDSVLSLTHKISPLAVAEERKKKGG